MGKTLILTEKPSVAKEIARVLGCTRNGNGCMTGDRYVVTWALGHLVTLADPETYDGKYKQWKLEDLPMLPDKMQLVVMRETQKQFQCVRALLQDKGTDGLIIATDAGREGELVARWIMEKAGWKKPVQRLWISSQTDKAIRDGFASLRPGKEYENLYASAQCRAEADWLVGLNITRALTCKHNAQLSAGRVQTPTLAMIADREEEIRLFVPKPFWTVQVQAQGIRFQWRDASGQTRTFLKAQAEQVAQKLSGAVAVVSAVAWEPKKELPPQAYDLTELQRDANRRYGMSPKKTLQVMQRLYEQHKLVTYPRTDSRYIPEDVVPTLPERLRAVAVGPWAAHARELLKSRPVPGKRLVDNSRVTDHHAILPTEESMGMSSLNSEERQIYDLIVRRFLAVLSPSTEFEQTTLTLKCQGEILTARGRVMKVPGWRSVYDHGLPEDEEAEERDEADQVLPSLQQGQDIRLPQVRPAEGKTQPPPRYTEATLLTGMEHPGRFVKDTALREALEQTSGLGTPATRADIIEKLFDSFMMERRGKDIVLTSKGKQLIGLVPEDLRSPVLTARWETRLQEISRGKGSPDAFRREIREYAARLVRHVVASGETYRHDNVTRERCECGQFMLEVNGKRGKMLVCPDRDCGFRKHLSQTTNARCPQCQKKMELRGDGEHKGFFCTCGYREKMDAFKKRKGDHVSKREVSKFLNNQEDETPVNSALADALEKLGL